MSFLLAPRRRRLVVLLVACLAAVWGGVATTGSASAKPPAPQPATQTPTSMVITSITSGLSAPDGAPSVGVPSVLAEPKTQLTIHVEFYTGATPASFSSDTNLTIGSNVGTLSSDTGLAQAGQTSADLSTSLTSAVNDVRLSVTVAKGPARGLTASAPDALVFDVLTQIQTKSATAGSAFTDGIGGDDSCTDATRADPVCGVVLLPSGAQSEVLLSTGLCDAAYRCDSHGALIQTLFNGGSLYDSANPATLILKCDKTLCGNGAIRKVPVNYSLSGNGPLDATATACPAEGTVGPTQNACVDYVQSKRDGAGDTILYLLFPHDMRGSVG